MKSEVVSIRTYNYNSRIIVQKRTMGKDASGCKTNIPDIEVINTCWADVGELSGKLQLEAINVKLENTVLFTCKYLALPNNLNTLEYKDKLFVVYKEQNYKVYFVDYHNNNKTNITLKCLEVI